MANAVSHDQNFKNLILDYPREALAFFAPTEAPALDDDVRIVPARQEQLKERLGDRWRELDVPLLVEWRDGRRDAVLFALEEESDRRRFSPHRLAHYCLDLAELFGTDRVVPVAIFLRAGPQSGPLVLGTERRRYLTFDHLALSLGELRAEDWRDSANLVARVNLPNMRIATDRVDIYAHAVRGLLELEPDGDRRAKYTEFIDIYAALTDNEFRRYQREHPEENSTMAGVIQRAREEGVRQGMERGAHRRGSARRRESSRGRARKACGRAWNGAWNGACSRAWNGGASRESGRCWSACSGGGSVACRRRRRGGWTRRRRPTWRHGPRTSSTPAPSTRSSASRSLRRDRYPWPMKVAINGCGIAGPALAWRSRQPSTRSCASS